MLALVTGGNGFIGSGLVDRLRAAGHQVRVLDQSVPRADVDWQGVDYVTGSLTDVAKLPALLNGVDLVFHLASSTVPSTSNLDPAADVQSNLIGALNLCQAMIEAGKRRLIFFSSGGTVYGNPRQLPVPETHALHPISSYGVVKVAIENYLLMYEQLGDLDPLILRPSNPYGPRQSSAGLQGVIAAFLGKARNGEEVRIWGDGEIVRDYLHIDDLLTFAITAGTGRLTGAVNVGSGAGHTLNQILDVVREVTDVRLPVEYAPARKYDVAEIVLDITRAITEFGWHPEVDLASGIRATWQTIRRHTS
ncbi:MAG: NAD-dependent epimerase/dehydratase family protein [Rhodanobacter lindaniclasticus]